MSSPQGGSGSGSGIVASVPSQILTATATAPVVASTARSSNASSTKTSSAATESSSSMPAEMKGIIAGAVIGGMAIIALICVVAVLVVQRRRQAKNERKVEKRTTVESRSYSGLNQNFKGVPFGKMGGHSHNNSTMGMPSPAPSSAYLLGAPSPAPSAVFSPTVSRYQPTSDPGYRGGSVSPTPSPYSITPEASIRMVPSDPSLLRSYTDGQHSRTVSEQNSRSSLGRLNTQYNIPPPPDLGAIVSPQTAVELETPMSPSFPFNRHSAATRDTMGFPVDIQVTDMGPNNYPDMPELPDRRPSAAPEPLFTSHGSGDYGNMASPQPTRPGLTKDALEHAVRERMAMTPSPGPSNLLSNQNVSRSLTPSPNPMAAGSRNSSGVSRVMAQEMIRESPVLGIKNPVVIQAQSKTLTDLKRNESQRTIGSVSSMPSVISDRELDRLGVGRI